MTNRQQDDPGGINKQHTNIHQMERTKLTDWKKLAKNKKNNNIDGIATTGEKRHKTSSNGAVRPGPKPWKKVNETAEAPMVNGIAKNSTTGTTTLDTMMPGGEMPTIGFEGGGRIIDGGRLSGFPGSPQPPHHSSPPQYDNRMFKIGLGVFGAIALILGSMLSVFYIQKKRKDEQLKTRRKHRQTKSPPQFPPESYPQYPQMPPMHHPQGLMGYDPQMQQYTQQQQYQQFQPQYAYQPQFEQFQNYSPAEQYYNQQAYEQNYYNMCQDYILQQRQMQMEQPMPIEYNNNNQVNPEIIMGENGYKTVMQYVDAIGENLKTPKSKRQKNVVDGASTPHPIITRRAPSMKSLAQSEVSCWTEYEVENEKDGEDQKSMDGASDVGSNMDQSEPPKDDAQSQKSDSAYGSRGSIQSPNRYRLKGQMANSQILESEHDSERDDMDSEHDNVNDELPEIIIGQNQEQLGKKTVSINVDEHVSVA